MEKFKGLQYPLIKTPRGILAQKSGTDQIKADMIQLLLTNPGERVMLPEYGTPLRELFFEQNDAILEIQARTIIERSLKRWEPRVIISNVSITSKTNKNDLNEDDPGDDIESILSIKIEFMDPKNISEVDQLVIEIPIGVGVV